jgi:hypothetical protein
MKYCFCQCVSGVGELRICSTSGLGTFLFTHNVLKHVDTNGNEFRAVEEIF